MTEETNNAVKQEVQQVQQAQQSLQVTAGDLALMVKIIDAGSERGAWKGEELGTIGTLRTKMATIVRAVAPVEDSVAEKEDAKVDDKPKKRAAKNTAA